MSLFFKNKIALATLMVLFWLSSGLTKSFSQSVSDCPQGEQAWTFAESLSEQGEFYRAITEYKRYLHLCPGSNLREKTRFTIGMCSFMGGQYAAAAREFETFRQTTTDLSPGKELQSGAFYLEARSYFELGEYGEAYRLFRELGDRTDNAWLHDRIQVQLIWTAIKNRAWDTAQVQAGKLTTSSLPAFIDFSQRIAERADLPQKNPLLAGGLSCILPGAGHAYTGRFRDAATAFFLNALLIFGTFQALDHDEDVLAGAIGSIELFMYSGTIMSAATVAHRYNRDQEDLFIRELETRYPYSQWDENWSRDTDIPQIRQ